VKFVRIAQVELSRPPAEPWDFQADIEGVTVKVQARRPGTPMRQFLVFAEVPLTSVPETDDAGMIVIATATARQAENAIEHLADLAAIATSSRRTITSTVPCAGFTGVTSQDREWLASCSGLLQPPRHLQLVPVSLQITDPAILALIDRRDGAQLLAEALADTHDTGRFREMARFFERAFRLQPAALVTPLASFLSHYDTLQYTRDEVERWHVLRNRATHADRSSQTYALARDVRPVVMRVELAAYDVLFNKLHWNQPDSARRSAWHPAGGVLPDEQHAVLRVDAQFTAEARQLIDGFGAYPYDRTCKIGQYPDDWWLDPFFRVQGQSSIETVGSLRTAGLPANGAPLTATSTVHRPQPDADGDERG
jgi:hypothetical protein